MNKVNISEKKSIYFMQNRKSINYLKDNPTPFKNTIVKKCGI